MNQSGNATICGKATHPLADAFPMMDEAALDALAEDIREHGLLHKPVLAPDGRILDGRNRARACEMIGIEPEWAVYSGEDELQAMARYVVRCNMHRRDLDPGQRALCARRLLKLVRVRKARERKQPDLPGVTDDALGQAEQVLAGASPELVAAVDAGDIPLSHAAEAAKLTHDEQRRLLERMRTVWSKAVALSSDDMDVLRDGYDRLGEHAATGLLERMVPGL